MYKKEDADGWRNSEGFKKAFCIDVVIDFVGAGVGIDGAAGHKFIVMTWAATILLFINMVLWAALFFIGERLPTPKTRSQKKAEALEMN